MTRRDTSGRTLQDYPRPSVAVDVAVLTVRANALAVVLVENARRVPGTFLHEGETLADSVRRVLKDKVGIEGENPEQLHVFDDPGRDDRGWVLSVAHAVTVPAARLDDVVEGVELQPVDGLGRLDFDHHRIVELAVERLRSRYQDRPDPDRLLAEPFTLRELQVLHETVAGGPLMRDTFRRRVTPLLAGTGERQRGVVGVPAQTFRHAAAPDQP